MEARLVPLNAALALLRGDAGWPAPLRDQGLACERLELPVTTAHGVVVIDVLAHDDPCGAIVPVEAKSGANVEVAQATKYLSMTPRDVAQVATMPGYRAGTAIQPVFACLEEHEPRIRKGLAEAEAAASPAGGNRPQNLGRFAILTVSATHARLAVPAGSPVQPFDVPLPGLPPPRIVPFDADSLRRGHPGCARRCRRRGDDRRQGSDLRRHLLASAVPYWSVYGRGVRNALSKRCGQVLRAASDTELKEFFTVVKGGSEHDSDIVRISKSPINYKPQGQTQGWQGVRRAAHKYLRRTPAPQIPGQGTFDALLREAEASEDE